MTTNILLISSLEFNFHPSFPSLIYYLTATNVLSTKIKQQFQFSRYIFTIVSYLIGVFIFATIVGQVGNVITNRNANRLEFERLLDGAKTYMRHHKVIYRSENVHCVAVMCAFVLCACGRCAMCGNGKRTSKALHTHIHTHE